MKDLLILIAHLLTRIAKLLGTGGARVAGSRATATALDPANKNSK